MADVLAETDRLRLQFFNAELELCNTFVRIARIEFDNGDPEHGKRTLSQAERGHQVLNGFLLDPKHYARLTSDQISALQEKLGSLRKEIDTVRASRGVT